MSLTLFRVAYNLDGCFCGRCVTEVISARPFPENLMYPMIVCETCGNKRCPRAAGHDNECSGSNEPGQVGSSYEHVVFPIDLTPIRAQVD